VIKVKNIVKINCVRKRLYIHIAVIIYKPDYVHTHILLHVIPTYIFFRISTRYRNAEAFGFATTRKVNSLWTIITQQTVFFTTDRNPCRTTKRHLRAENVKNQNTFGSYYTRLYIRARGRVEPPHSSTGTARLWCGDIRREDATSRGRKTRTTTITYIINDKK